MALCWRLEAGGMTVVWGHNHFVDCVALLAWKGELVLGVASGPLRIDLKTPTTADVKRSLRIEANMVVESSSNDVNVIARDASVSILLGDAALLMAHDLGDGNGPRIMLHTDLRLLGMNIFDDSAGLHVGGSTLARNRFVGLSTAIALG